ncbi:MAG: single-stranded-DNA-specific exonuclease RecJ [Phycisphaerales bacterium]
MGAVNGLTRRWRLPGAFQAQDGATGIEPPSAGGAGAASALAIQPDRHVAIAGPVTLVERLLAARGLRDADALRLFCDPKLNDLHDPGLLPGVDPAAERIVAALRRRERIAIYGDYDVDGITATAILFHVLRTADPEAVLRCYVPHRIDEGYGLNGDALRTLRAEGATLAVSVDCGVTAREPAEAAREVGLDLIVTDHHHAPAEAAMLPRALAIVHPSLPGADAPYPFPDLCGAGVAFKLAWRIATRWCGSERVSDAFRRVLLDMLPLAALGTIADVVPLVGENRVIASIGLRAIKSTPLPGLRALIESSGLAGSTIDSEKVGFVLAPRLNACGRLGHAAEAVKLLTDVEPEEAARIAAELAALNRDRQRTEQAIAAQACELAERTGQVGDDHRAIVLAHEQWHPGVVGIVCSRLVERFGRPTILLQRQGDLLKGSARSIDGYSIHDGLASCAEHLLSFGGHAAAAGLSLRAERLDDFRAALVTHANARLSVAELVPSLRIDCAADLAELHIDAVRQLARLSPFGRGNPRPALIVRDAIVAGEPRPIKEHHVKFMLRQDGREGPREVAAIWWDGLRHARQLHRGRRVHAVVDPRISSFSGMVEVEVRDVALVG